MAKYLTSYCGGPKRAHPPMAELKALLDHPHFLPGTKVMIEWPTGVTATWEVAPELTDAEKLAAIKEIADNFAGNDLALAQIRKVLRGE